MTWFDLSDVQSQTFVLRMLHSVIILGACIELLLACKTIQSHRVNLIVFKLAMFFLVFFISRIFAGVLDSYVAYGIGWASNVVNIVFWSVVLFRCTKFRRIVNDSRNSEHRISLRLAFDDLLHEMEGASKNLQKLQKN